MSQSNAWERPSVDNDILQDVPFIREALNALAQGSPEKAGTPPDGSYRMVKISPTELQIQCYSAVDQLWNTVGNLKHNILGTATGLSQINPIEMGGTGAATPQAAREALDVPDNAALTALDTKLTQDYARADMTNAAKATHGTAGTVIIGQNITLGPDGKIGVAFPEVPKTSQDTFGITKPDNTTLIAEAGVLQLAPLVQERINTAAKSDMTNAAIASSSALGVVKVGKNLHIGEDGELSAIIPDVKIATHEAAGTVKPNADFTLQADGTLGIDPKKMVNSYPLGAIFLSLSKTPPEGAIPCDGNEYSKALYQDLFTLVQARGDVLSETQWQEVAAANGGYCAMYSDKGDTFRTPKPAPYLKIALANSGIGVYQEAGLPNITGTVPVPYWEDDDTSDAEFNTGAFQLNSTPGVPIVNVNGGADGVSEFDASRSNPIYGKSTTVQPESLAYGLYVQAIGIVNPIGEADAVKIMAAVEQMQRDKVNVDFSNVDLSQYVGGAAKAFDYIVETGVVENPYAWYRKYKSGWLEQGGIVDSGEWSNVMITLPQPYKDINYSIAVHGISSSSDENGIGCINHKSPTQFCHYFYNDIELSPSWFTSGQGVE